MKRPERVSSIPSPFGPVFGPQFDQLPPVFRAQYFPSADPARPLRLLGRMDHIWHRPAWLWPILWLLAQADIIFPETGSAIDASMCVMPGRDRHGRPYLKWDRLFGFKVPRRFNAVMLYDPRLKRIIERMGPLGLLEVVWDMRFEPPDTINISTVGCVLRVGHHRLGLPRLLYPDVTAVERALEDSQGISIYLSVAHPLLGPIFGYRGTFHIEPPFAPKRKINHK